MCRASISPSTGRPIVTATLILPQLGVSHDATFLLDTGADKTSLDGLTSVATGIHPDIAPDEISITRDVSKGVGGETEQFTVSGEVWLALEEEHPERDLWSLHVEHVESIDILPNAPTNLLGRDVLNRFSIDFSPNDGYVELVRDDFGGGHYECLTLEDQPSERLGDWV